jgi:tricorn protease
MTPGYYRFPTVAGDQVIFVCEDDLWAVPLEGGVARRLTANLGEISRPWLSPDGQQVAFIGREEGHPEVYLMPAAGGPPRRLTYLGGSLTWTAGWTSSGNILFASNAGHWYLRFSHLYEVNPASSEVQRLEYGNARAIAFGPNKGVVLGRNIDDPARWKRYRGGTVGQIWIDTEGTGNFQPLINLGGNLASPLWLLKPGSTGRVYFISDHEGVGNLYSVLPSGDDLRCHSRHSEYYTRNASTDGQKIVYHAGADLYVYDPEKDITRLIPIEFHSPRTQRSRKFVEASRFLQDWHLQSQGSRMAISTRGKLFTFSNWEGAVRQHFPDINQQENDHPITGVRCRLPRWLSDGKRLIGITDAGGEEKFVIFDAEGSSPPRILPELSIGRPDDVAVSPVKDQIVFSNHRYELHFLDLETNELRRIDRGRCSQISGFSWSPDGEWVAYSVSISLQVQVLKLWHATSGEISTITRPVLRDIAPAFDPEGRYLYFLSYRTFDPVYDNLHFDLGFPMGMKPYLIPLQKDLTSPFIAQPAVDKPQQKSSDSASQQSPDADAATDEENPPTEAEASPPLIHIDLDGIQERILAFPVAEGIYGKIIGAADGKVIYSRFPIAGVLDQPQDGPEPSSKGSLYIYNFEDLKEEYLFGQVAEFQVSQDGKYLGYRSSNRLRVSKVGDKLNGEIAGFSRKNGWLDLNRVKVSILPGAEWRQMFREAWRLQRDQFWTPDMSQVDWVAVHDHYLALVDRISSRSEFSDLMWEMQGELGTSHAYEFGGDYRPEPAYHQGFLGADYEFDHQHNAWKIVHIHHGDSWNPAADSPLSQPGMNVNPGDWLIAINGQILSISFPPAAALTNQSGQEVLITIRQSDASPDGSDETTRTLTVKTLTSEMQTRYREWVEANRQRVHNASDGRIGYVHIPDMMGLGYAEFHRGYLAETDRQGLIVDVRYNRGGHVSALLLEKLARRRIGYDISRWGDIPSPYPPDSVIGPMVAIANEYTGSDGDIFSHGFKLMKLGPLIGTRTWGGVIGINPSHFLVDGTVTTQPEYSFWFQDVGWGVENYGTDPDIKVDITPQDYIRGVDSQLERALNEITRLLAENPPPQFTPNEKPSRAWPKLPKQ